MKAMKTQWVHRFAALGLLSSLTAGFTAAGVAQSVSGQAYGAYANTPLGSVGQTALAVLPPVSRPTAPSRRRSPMEGAWEASCRRTS